MNRILSAPLSLRGRMGLAAGVAVALAVLAVAVGAYAGTRSQLRGQIDDQLNTQLHAIPQLNAGEGGGGGGLGGGPSGGLGGAPRGGPGGAVPPGGSGSQFGAGAPGDCDRGLGFDFGRRPFGGQIAVVQAVGRSGRRCTAQGATAQLPVDTTTKRIAAAGSGRHLTDMTVGGAGGAGGAGGTHIRVLSAGIPGGGAVEIALPLTQVDHALSSQLLLLAVIAAAGIALAAVLGILVARTALAPVARFTRSTESIAAAPDVSRRLEVQGDDELARLAITFNHTLDELERSVEAQRNLVADASHELRTPISTLRANLQLLRDEQRLSPEDRAALREDMIEELDELTGLVADVVELARGSKPSGEAGDVQLDAIVASLVDRTRRRAPGLTVTVDCAPTLIRGEPERIARAVANLLDNARKWSPEGGTVEVAVRDAVVSVRDRGPGFHEEDLPFVFDRFHRARDARSKPGSGLGLAIVRQAAEAHGGFARASNAPGGGALLEVSFGPAISVAERDESEPVTLPASRGS